MPHNIPQYVSNSLTDLYLLLPCTMFNIQSLEILDKETGFILKRCLKRLNVFVENICVAWSPIPFSSQHLLLGTHFSLTRYPDWGCHLHYLVSVVSYIYDKHSYVKYFFTDAWKKKIEDNTDWLMEGVQFKTDESKRPGKPRTAETIFGVEGSFRQLNVD